MKRLKTLIVFALSISFALGAVSCKTETQTAENEIKIGSAYNTLKILRDASYEDLGRQVSISMAKGETEGGQLLITPERDVKRYTASVSDLTGENGAKISKDNVKIFVQKYLEVKNKSDKQNNTDYPPGFYPDMLLPMDIAAAYGENRIGGGHNQGLTVEVTTDADTLPGAYAGTLTLDLDGKTETVPVSVTVWDIDVTRSYGRTSVSWWPTGTMTGETAFTPELYTRYYETMLNDYRTNMAKLPGSYDPDSMARSVLKYWEHPDFTSYAIPGDFTTAGKFNSGRFIDYLYALAKYSEPGKILVEKGYVYNIDEPKSTQYPKIDEVREAIYWCEDEVLLRLESEGYFDRFDARYKADFTKAMTGVSIVIPVAGTSVVTSIGPAVNTYCAVIDQLDTERYRELYKAAAEQTADRGGSTWYYTCVQPLYPYPTHHIDDALIGSRIMRWMQKSYDLEGYLYWALGAFYTLSGGGWSWADPYENPVRYNNGSAGTNGDGYLIYPGAKYGHDTFFGSLRLTTLRDSQEDLNMLYELDNLLRRYETFYGLDEGYFDMNDLVREVYESLFTGTRYEKSDANFYAQREKLAGIITGMRGDAKLAYKTVRQGGTATVELFAANGYTLRVDGEAVGETAPSGSGFRAVVTRELTKKTVLEVEVLKDGSVIETKSLFVGDRTAEVALGDPSVAVTEGSEKTAEDGGLRVKFVSRGETVVEKTGFNPALTLPESLFGGSYKNVGDMTWTVRNTENFDVTVFVRLQSGSRRVVVKENLTIPANETVTFTVRNVGDNAIIVSNGVNVQLCLINVDEDNNLLSDRTLVVEQVIYTAVA